LAIACSSCGASNPGEGHFCVKCGAVLPPAAGGAATIAPALGVPATPADPPASSPFGVYAGFWERFLAIIIDGFVLSAVSSVIQIPLMFVLPLFVNSESLGRLSSGDISIAVLAPYIVIAAVVGGLLLVLSWLYHALMTASSRQATLGKQVLHLIVTDLDGERLSFGRATGRFFATFLSYYLLLIGYVIQPFTEKRQALHDILAGTLVVKR